MNQNKPELLSLRQKAWIAGFMDGEGYLGIVRQRKKETRTQSPTLQYHPYIIISNTQRNVIDRIQSWTGLGTIVKLGKKGRGGKYRIS